MQIVFVSSDNDAGSFQAYLSEMPWLAVPFENEHIRAKLGSKFSIYGIPSLVIIDASGKQLTKSGREAVYNDPKGQQYPWENYSSGWCNIL